MDGGSRRQTGGSHGEPVDKSILDRTMLRFRPIAPKPAGSVAPNRKFLVSVARKKRKYSKARKRRSGDGSSESSVVTLQLLPERTEAHDLNNPAKIAEAVTEAWVPLSSSSWVTVERVTGTCEEGPVLTDAERVRALEGDACPGFVSDGWDRIRWVNGAYRRMVAGDDHVPCTAWLVGREGLPPHVPFPAYTCRVRLKYTWREEMKSLAAPSDVWEMDGGGLAWRLDIDAALTLTL